MNAYPSSLVLSVLFYVVVLGRQDPVSSIGKSNIRSILPTRSSLSRVPEKIGIRDNAIASGYCALFYRGQEAIRRQGRHTDYRSSGSNYDPLLQPIVVLGSEIVRNFAVVPRVKTAPQFDIRGRDHAYINQLEIVAEKKGSARTANLRRCKENNKPCALTKFEPEFGNIIALLCGLVAPTGLLKRFRATLLRVIERGLCRLHHLLRVPGVEHKDYQARDGGSQGCVVKQTSASGNVSDYLIFHRGGILVLVLGLGIAVAGLSIFFLWEGSMLLRLPAYVIGITVPGLWLLPWALENLSRPRDRARGEKS
jgi:hypothetical protein